MLGIIPAAGEGSRWGGYYKEFLYVDDECLIDRCIRSMRMASRVCIVSSEAKLVAHVHHLKRHDNLLYCTQRGGMDIWGAIYEALPFAESINLFAMPDTFFPDDAFIREFPAPFTLGVFETDMPERFGCILDGVVVNKRPLRPPQHAWGTMVFHKEVSDFWLDISPISYTDAINEAITEFGLATYPLDYYYDMASFEDYRRLIC